MTCFLLACCYTVTMKTVLYIDMLFIQGVLINYTLLLCSARFATLPINKLRIAVAAIIGGLASFMIFLPSPAIFLQVLIKIAVTVIMTLVAYKTKKIGYIKGFFWYVFFNCVLAGLVLLFYFTGGNGVIIQNMQIYFDISSIFLVASTLTLYISATAIRMIFVSHTIEPVDLTLKYGDNSFSLPAIYDSGFTAKDLLNNAPLIILDYNSCKEGLPQIITQKYEQYQTDGMPPNGSGMLPLNSISGTELIFTVYPVTVYCNNKTVNGIKLCISKNKVELNSVNCLMSKEFMEVLNHVKEDKKNNS